jgi:hypothetical protein
VTFRLSLCFLAFVLSFFLLYAFLTLLLYSFTIMSLYQTWAGTFAVALFVAFLSFPFGEERQNCVLTASTTLIQVFQRPYDNALGVLARLCTFPVLKCC